MSKTATQRKTPAQKANALEQSPRPFRAHYSGIKVGACKTVEGALIAAFGHLIRGESSAATIVGPRDDDRARMHWTSVGLSVWCPPEQFRRPHAAKVGPTRIPHPHLHRVK